MRRKIIVFFIVFICLLISYIHKKENSSIENIKNEQIKNESVNETRKVNLLYEDEIIDLELENYIIGVVSCEMPASFEEEALKAMAVASRTYALYKMKKNNKYDLKSTTSDQCYITESDMKKKWGDDYDKYYSKIKNAVNDTSGEYMTYNDEVIIAFYFSISNGYTENCENVFSQKLDYLVSVESSWDEEYSFKEKDVVFSINDFLDNLGITDNDIDNISFDRSSTGRVNSVKINNYSFKGTKFRSLLGLRSTDFDILVDDGNVLIKTKGYGHGVGMSQYGAHSMAKMGYSYDEILKYYYSGINIVNN